MKTVKITDNEFAGKEEWYGPLFKCPICEKERIFSSFKFCPMCGIEIEHDHKDYSYDEDIE